MSVFVLIVYFMAFVVIPGSIWFIFWVLGKLAGIFLPAAASVGKWTGTAIAAVLILLLLCGAAFGWRIFRVRNFEIPFAALPESFDGYRIAHISDWHLGTYSRSPKTIAREVEKVLELKPDMIVFTGDIVNYDPAELKPFKDVISRLEAPDGVWSVMGNHDYCMYYPDDSSEVRAGLIRQIQDFEREIGWNLLLNENAVIYRGCDSLAMIGVENGGRPPFPQYADLEKACSGLSEDVFKIILSHDPTHWRRAVLPETDIDLMLSGHTHAMQFRIGKFSPAKLAFQEWGGLYEEGERKIFVSTGSGGNIPIRFGAWPEVDILTLKKKDF